MRRHSLSTWIALALSAFLAAACAAKRPSVLEPPRLDLSRYETLGLVEFRASGAKELAALATREFLSSVHAAQPGTPMLELGSAGRALGVAAGEAPDPEAVRALAARSHVDAIVLGEIHAQTSQPRMALDPAYGTASASASLQGTLDVRILDGATGATVWSASARGEVPLAGIDLTARGISRLDANPVEEARAALVQSLVDEATFDLRPHWVQH